MIVGICGVAGSGKDASADFLVRDHAFCKVAFADPLKRICQDVYDFTDEQLWGPSACRNAPDLRWEHGARQYRAAALGDFETGRNRALASKAAELQWQEDPVVLSYFESAVNYATEGWLTPRHALQQLGTEWGRSCSPETWVRYAFNVHARLQTGDTIYDAKTGIRGISFAGDLVKTKTDIIISDVRFKNEVDAIHAAGGKVVRVMRKERRATPALNTPVFNEVPNTLEELIANTSFLTTLNKGKAAAHLSETEQLSIPDEYFDHHLVNGGTDLALLGAAVAGLAEALRAAWGFICMSTLAMATWSSTKPPSKLATAMWTAPSSPTAHGEPGPGARPRRLLAGHREVEWHRSLLALDSLAGFEHTAAANNELPEDVAAEPAVLLAVHLAAHHAGGRDESRRRAHTKRDQHHGHEGPRSAPRLDEAGGLLHPAMSVRDSLLCAEFHARHALERCLDENTEYLRDEAQKTNSAACRCCSAR